MARPRDPRWLTGLLLVAIVAILGRAVVAVAMAQAQVTAFFWTIDPQTNFVAQESLDHTLGLALTFERQVAVLRHLAWLGVFCITLLLVQLHRRRREHPSRLWLALPVLVPVAVTLAGASLVGNRQAAVLEQLHGWLSDAELGYAGDELGDCARLLALETVGSAIALVLVVASVALLVLAAVVIWRTRRDGSRLGRGWRIAALVCFGLGVVAVTATRGHRADRRQALVSCAQDRVPIRSYWFDTAPDASRGMPAEPCVSPRELAEIHDLNFAGFFQLRASGQLIEEGGLRFVEPSRAFHGVLADEPFPPESHFAISLHVARTAPMSALAEVLVAAREANVKEVLLLGSGEISGEFETIGPWRRHIQCGLGVLHFDAPQRHLSEYRSLAELAAAASAPGGLAPRTRRP
ncbi:MAG: hypothetical protein KC431_06115 [Myxococcales bacterium]|nr:hypothetical protein [Myxococcales bacterium]